MKKILILILLVSISLISACTIQFPAYKPELGKCCIALDYSTVTDCTYAETDVICSDQFSGENTQFVNMKCSDLSQCKNKISCSYNSLRYNNGFIGCIDTKLYTCTQGNMVKLNDNCCIDTDNGKDYYKRGEAACLG